MSRVHLTYRVSYLHLYKTEQAKPQGSVSMTTMSLLSDTSVGRPTACPFCKGKVIDTLAKVMSVLTSWRCLNCQRTWTIASLLKTPALAR